MSAKSLSLWAVYRKPVYIGAICGISLFCGIVGDGVWDVISCCGLALPVALIGSILLLPQRSARRR